MTRRITFVSLTVLLTAVVYLVVTVLASIAGWVLAHADTGAVATPELSLEAKLAAWSVAVYAIARTVLEVLKAIAPLTRTPVDDQVRDALLRVLGDARPPTSSGGAPTGTER